MLRSRRALLSWCAVRHLKVKVKVLIFTILGNMNGNGDANNGGTIKIRAPVVIAKAGYQSNFQVGAISVVNGMFVTATIAK